MNKMNLMRTEDEIRKVIEALVEELNGLNPTSKANSEGMIEMAEWVLGISDELDDYL